MFNFMVAIFFTTPKPTEIILISWIFDVSNFYHGLSYKTVLRTLHIVEWRVYIVSKYVR